MENLLLKFKMKYTSLYLVLFLLLPLVQAETTFFDQDDVFIMNNPPTTGGVIITEEQQGGGGCTYKWNCTNWSECLPSGKQIRNCANIGTCSDTYKTPEIEQNCTYTTPKSKEGETEEIIWKEMVNKIFICFILILIIGFIIFYLKKDYFEKVIKKFK